MAEGIIKTEPSLSITQDGITFGVETSLGKLPRPAGSSRPPSHWSKDHGQEYLGDLNGAFDLAAHIRSSQWLNSYDLYRLKDSIRSKLCSVWKDDIDDIVKTSVVVMGSERGVKIDKPLTDGEYTTAPKIDWSRALTGSYHFSSADKPKYHDTDMERFHSWNWQDNQDNVKEETLRIPIKFSKDMLRTAMHTSRDIQVPSHTMVVTYPWSQGDYIEDIDNLVFDFDSTRRMYGQARSEKNGLNEEDRMILSQVVKSAYTLASRIRAHESGGEVETGKGLYRKDDLNRVMSKLTSLNGHTAQRGRRLSYFISDEEGAATRQIDRDDEYDRWIWKNLSVASVDHAGPAQPIDLETIKRLREISEGSQATFDHLKQSEDGLSVADYILRLYSLDDREKDLVADSMLCGNILEEVADGAE
ncbi:hypothetical protein I203_102012 [Kwoniella mangroviensis CBS 8507]|uniref:uncharacterized protein n=1 Tax=Kwoniella mangroviensis CBS 8507 TaxID=1296122 RepID=UPI00080D2DBA|nr:uncharacterized protein I203_03208 [Kwoniella mangroviensis CBS 8507]OCF67511.1 hypothetical protein I203_03208 [Kwoniella mangroviensis CBS 8507]